MKKIISFLILICIIILSSCSNPSTPQKISSRGETASYKYAIIKQDEDDSYYIIEEEIEFKEGYNPISLKKVEFSNAVEIVTPEKLKIYDEKIDYRENISLNKTSFILTIYDNKSRHGNEKHFDLHYYITIEYKDLKSDNIFTTTIEGYVIYPKSSNITAY